MTDSLKTRVKWSLMRTLHHLNAPAYMPRSISGIGIIITLHRVRPNPRHDFAPLVSLEITPEFLARIIERLQALDVEIIDLDSAMARLEGEKTDRRFACITLDDGYHDNYEYARPIFERYQAPYAIYLTTGLPDRTAIFWWLVLEEQIRQREHISLRVNGEIKRYRTVSIEEKHQTYAELRNLFRTLPAAACADMARHLCDEVNVDPATLCAAHGMTWDMVREIASSEFGHIEAHTTQHMAVSRQTRNEMIEDIEAGIDRTVAETGIKPRHFAYPYGDRNAAGPREYAIAEELPLVSATTTIEGVLQARHKRQMLALPRLCINGYYQSDEYLDLTLCGISPLLERSH